MKRGNLLAVGCTEYEIELDGTTLYRLNKRTGEVVVDEAVALTG